MTLINNYYKHRYPIKKKIYNKNIWKSDMNLLLQKSRNSILIRNTNFLMKK